MVSLQYIGFLEEYEVDVKFSRTERGPRLPVSYHNLFISQKIQLLTYTFNKMNAPKQ